MHFGFGYLFRGRYSMKVFPSFLQLHGKTYDYKIPYTSVLRLFLLPHKDQRFMFFVVSIYKMHASYHDFHLEFCIPWSRMMLDNLPIIIDYNVSTLITCTFHFYLNHFDWLPCRLVWIHQSSKDRQDTHS